MLESVCGGGHRLPQKLGVCELADIGGAIETESLETRRIVLGEGAFVKA